ncbi:MAG: alpha-ketoacid dehydrogenase subunit beta [Candidatus Omnitrophica bacterium]|nr:alpha-ketoacid dehydrogenase subunit beta [Candidatus Omnitrophota bacterium]
MRELTYREAINEALFSEMERDPSVFTYGIDVADHKNIFGSTKGILDKFGPKRCFSTPLSEDAMTGFGLGAALCGLRPIHTHMRVDFLLLAMNQLANMVSSYRYATNGTLKVPMVIRAIIGRGWGQAFQHSKSMHSCFAHIPGLKVAMPSTPNDAKHTLIAAIRDDSPVIIFEHRWLYDICGPINDHQSSLGKAKVLRCGKDISVIATSWMNVEAIKAAEILQKRGIEVEVVDPITLTPLDEQTLIDSVNKTGHCIVADNDWVHCGFGAELAAVISEKSFDNLKSPVKRIGFAFSPCPCARPLEDRFYPNAVNIIRAIEEKLAIDETDLSGEDFYTYENKFKGPF